jgi:hypothetical protein
LARWLITLFAVGSLPAAPVWQIGGQTFEARIGSLHSHTGLSDGTGSPEEAFAHARDVAHMDWWGVSDHLFPLDDPRRSLDETTYAELRSTAAAFDEPGRFVAFAGYEWTVGAEHVVTIGVTALVRSRELEILAEEALREGGLLNYSHLWLSANPALWQRRHPVFSGVMDQTIVVTDVFPVPGYRSVFEEMIGAGYRVGAFAGQDNHVPDWGESGGNFGWAVVWTRALDRADLIEAFREARTFGTRLRDLDLRLWVGDVPMGGMIDTTTETATLRLENAPSPLRLEVLRDGIQIFTQLIKPEGVFEMTLPMIHGGPGRHAYHVRLWRDGETVPVAVSSPIWIGVPGPQGLAVH